MNDIFKAVEEAKQAPSYKNYMDVRERVINMISETYGDNDVPSDYWEEELEGFDYLLDASPLIIRKIREHSYHITGLKSYEYRRHHSHKAKVFELKLEALKKLDGGKNFIPEARELGGFGHEVDGNLVNIDTLKFYESLIALEKKGILTNLQNQSERPVIVEIGGGWGGFAYQFKTAVPNTTYIIIDLPQTMIFSGVYLKTLFPDAKIFIYGDEGHRYPPQPIKEYDFVFMPHYSVDSFELDRLDLGINMVSFQEMTTEQVEGYVNWLHKNKCKTIYSHNRARSAHNTQLSDVSQIIAKKFDVEVVDVLPVPYTVLDLPKPEYLDVNPKIMAKQILKKMLKPIRLSSSHLDYRHLIGYPKV